MESDSQVASSAVNPLLKGIRVLDRTRLLPGPFCTLYLAQLGAEIIKLEEPGCGDYAHEMPQLFAQVNRGKKSVTLTCAQKRIARLLCAWSKTPTSSSNRSVPA